MNFDNYRVVHAPTSFLHVPPGVVRRAGCPHCVFQHQGACKYCPPEDSPLGCFKALQVRHPELADLFLRRAIWFHWVPAEHSTLED